MISCLRHRRRDTFTMSMLQRSRSSTTTAICRPQKSRRTSAGVTLPSFGSAATIINGVRCAQPESMSSSAPAMLVLGKSFLNTLERCRNSSAIRSITGRTSNWLATLASMTACLDHRPRGTFLTDAMKCSRSPVFPRAGSWSARMSRWSALPTIPLIPWNITAPSRQIQVSKSKCSQLGAPTKRY